ncbi:MAG TPA: iron ABC transporter permease [Abditibacteriaceae bacterium]|jgi:iron(III) transport system permease protein
MPDTANVIAPSSGRAFPVTSIVTWVLCALTLGPFLIYPVARVLMGALVQDGQFTPSLLLLPVNDPSAREAMRNSFVIGVAATIVSALLAIPLAWFVARLRFPGKNFLTGLLLVPLLLPPLVGAVGLRQMLGREGLINSLLREIGLIKEPIEFLQMQAPMVVIVMALHLYPLIYLNLSAAWANIDPTLEEAGESMGASGWLLWRTITLPLLLPGFLAGALIVFIFAFVDLGTPLVFNYRQVAAVQIFDAKTTFNVVGYVLAFWMTVLAGGVFWISRRFLDGGRIATLSRAATAGREQTARGWQLLLVYGVLGLVIFLALLPHIGVVLASFARDWTSRLLPEWTLENYHRVFTDPTIPAANAIKISLLCATLSMLLDIIGGFFLAYALVRGKVWGRAFLDTIAMLPLALPGLILAFGLLTGYIRTPLDPITYSPIPLLVISYAIRRLPYALRSVSGGLQQMSVTLEEASLNLGASPLQTVWQVTRPLVMANLLAAGLLTFAFAVLEVSDSLVLAANRDYAPIAQAIFQLSIATTGGTFLACALGVVGMALLTFTFLLVNRLIGRQLGSLFRA